jgi:hypothetical protein
VVKEGMLGDPMPVGEAMEAFQLVWDSIPGSKNEKEERGVSNKDKFKENIDRGPPNRPAEAEEMENEGQVSRTWEIATKLA